MSTNWVFSVTPENWEIVKQRNIWAASTEGATQKISPGDRLVFYVTRTKPPAFLGIYEVMGHWRKTGDKVWADERTADELFYPYQCDIKPIKQGTAYVKQLKDRLGFIENKKNFQVYLIGTPANLKRPISEMDYQTILSALGEGKTEIESKPPELSPVVPKFPVSLRHNEVRDLIRKIGQLKSYISETEHPMDGLRVDAVWKTVPQAAPNWVFEVQMGGDIYEALTKLKHAHDIWNSRHLYLVTTEDYIDQAQWLLTGAFHQIRNDAKVIHWRKVAELFEFLDRASMLEKELGVEGKI